MSHTTDNEARFVTGADTIGLAERKAPTRCWRSAPSAARRLPLPTTRGRESLKMMVEV